MFFVLVAAVASGVVRQGRLAATEALTPTLLLCLRLASLDAGPGTKSRFAFLVLPIFRRSLTLLIAVF